MALGADAASHRPPWMDAGVERRSGLLSRALLSPASAIPAPIPHIMDEGHFHEWLLPLVPSPQHQRGRFHE